jgi:hypothetical protein
LALAKGVKAPADPGETVPAKDIGSAAIAEIGGEHTHSVGKAVHIGDRRGRQGLGAVANHGVDDRATPLAELAPDVLGELRSIVELLMDRDRDLAVRYPDANAVRASTTAL